MELLKRKLTSRKLWMALCGFISSLIVAFNGTAAVAETVTGCIMAGATMIAYVLGEGLVDSTRLGDQEEKE